MFPEQLKKILNLLKITGERVVVFDPSTPDDSYVLMSFDSYAETVIKKKAANPNVEINNLVQPAAVKPELSAVKPELSKSELSLNPDKLAKNENLTEEDLTDKINREISMWKNQEDLPYSADDNKPKKAWQIPGTVKDKAQEIV